MKKLLSSISTLVLGGTSLSSMPIMTQNQINQKNVTEAVQYYWNDKHTEEISEVIADNNNDPFAHIVILQKNIYTVNLGVNKPKFDTLSFVNSTGFKAVWREFNETLPAPDFTVLFEHENYYQFDPKNIDYSNFDKFTTIDVYDKTFKSQAIEKCKFSVKVGNVWYNENDVYYMQFLLYQYVEMGPSLDTTGTNYVSLGDKLELK